MRILNLADPKKGNIEYSVLSFSDGQKLINLGGLYAKGNTNVEDTVQIVSRMSWEDVQLIVCATKALREAELKVIHLYVPYFLGARSDRKFQPGSVNYLKEVICPIINSLEFASVTVLDPHSNCLEMGLKNFKKTQCDRLYHEVISDLDTYPDRKEDLYHDTTDGRHYDDRIFKKLTFVSPDKGAKDRVEYVAKLMNHGDVLVCDKVREVLTGKILSISLSGLTDFKGGDVVVIDDICDGGATFIELGQRLRLHGAGRLILVVTHGIFSKGFNVLTDIYDAIYCTDSVMDMLEIRNFHR